MIYPIVKYGAPVLEQEAHPVTEFDAELRRLVADMFESMYAAHGVGLAAPQIGIPRQLAVIDITTGQDPAARLVLANPRIIRTEGKQREEEGCLSLPGFHAAARSASSPKPGTGAPASRGPPERTPAPSEEWAGRSRRVDWNHRLVVSEAET